MESQEINLMYGQARRYLASAELLRREHDDDSAMSRRHYAMFYTAEAFLLAHGQTFASHREVISTFAKVLVKGGSVPKEMHQ